jgi:hypothetical protein
VSVDPKDVAFRASKDHSPHLTFARWVLGMFCVGEASSVALLAASRGGGTDPCVDAVLRTLHEDEILHDEIGWALAGFLAPTFSDDERDWLGAELAIAFGFYERLHAPRMPAERSDQFPEPERPGPNLGVLTEETHARTFYERMERVVLPRLDALGIPAFEAWALRRGPS